MPIFLFQHHVLRSCVCPSADDLYYVLRVAVSIFYDSALQIPGHLQLDHREESFTRSFLSFSSPYTSSTAFHVKEDVPSYPKTSP